ncbi:DUF4097 family beta strand repeat-containing protein, partial [Paludifilum halophilum]
DYNQLEINVDNASVNILSSEEESPRVEYISNKENDYFNVETEGNSLKINTVDNKLSFFNIDFFFFGTPSINVYLPEKSLEHIQTKSDNGKLSITNIEATSISLNTDNGKINVEDIDSSTFHAETNNG